MDLVYVLNAAFFNCTPVGRASDYDGHDLKLFILVGWGRSFLSVALPTGVQLVFSFAPELVGYSAPRDLHRRAAYLFLIHQDVYHDLFVCS